jgi:NTE family protein
MDRATAIRRHVVTTSVLAISVALLVGCSGRIHDACPPPSQVVTSHPATRHVVRRALVLSGGGPTGRAFEVGLLKALRDAGVDLTDADLVVGTSAGSVLGAQLGDGVALDAIYDDLVGPPVGQAIGPTDPGYDPAYFLRTIQMVNGAVEVTPALRAAVGTRALAATGVLSEDEQLRFIDVDLGGVVHRWPAQQLKVAAGDVADGTMRFFDASQGVPIEEALAASTALPGRVAPIAIRGHRYMDGFVGGPCLGGCWPNLDGARGYGVVVVIMTGPVGPALAQQLQQLRSQGSRVVVISPDAQVTAARGTNPFDLSRLGPTAQAALREASSVLSEVHDAWGQAGQSAGP